MSAALGHNFNTKTNNNNNNANISPNAGCVTFLYV